MQGAWTWNEVPNLIAVERKKGAKEVVMVDGVMHYVVWKGMLQR